MGHNRRPSPVFRSSVEYPYDVLLSSAHASATESTILSPAQCPSDPFQQGTLGLRPTTKCSAPSPLPRRVAVVPIVASPNANSAFRSLSAVKTPTACSSTPTGETPCTSGVSLIDRKRKRQYSSNAPFFCISLCLRELLVTMPTRAATAHHICLCRRTSPVGRQRAAKTNRNANRFR